MLDHVERLARRRDSGFALDEREMSPLEYRLLLMFDTFVETSERSYRLAAAHTVAALIARG